MAGELALSAPGMKLVAIEGIDGSGKTTLAAGLAAALSSRGISTVVHREPSAGPVGLLFRHLSAAGYRDPVALALLSAADRHDQQAWLARLEAGVVISDRYYLSGLAYHGADGVDPVFYQQLNHGARRPDLYLFLDVDSRTAALRCRGGRADRWERGSIAARVPEAYEAALSLVMATENAHVTRLDAAAPAPAVLGQALAALTPLAAAAGEAARG